MTEDLRPCPFCGGRAFLDWYGEKATFAPKMARSVECTGCDAFMFHLADTQEEADRNLTERWNGRAEAGSARRDAFDNRVKWIGTALQLTGCVIVALHLSWSGWAFPIMLSGSLGWLSTALVTRDKPLAVLNLAYSATNILGLFRWLG